MNKIKNIRKLLEANQIDEAINKLGEVSEETLNRKDFVLIKSRYSAYKENLIYDLLDYEALKIERNQIVNSILQVTDMLIDKPNTFSITEDKSSDIIYGDKKIVNISNSKHVKLKI